MGAMQWEDEGALLRPMHVFARLFGFAPSLANTLGDVCWQGALPRVGVFGLSGAGKSSLCNALAGKPVTRVSDVEAGTRTAKAIPIGSSLIVVDVPGVAESPERHERYKRLYRRLMPSLDLVLWVTKADERPRAIAQEIFDEVFSPHNRTTPVLVVLSQADKIEPIRESKQSLRGIIGATQRDNLKKRCSEFAGSLDMALDDIVPVSIEGFNLRVLNHLIIGRIDEVRRRVDARVTTLDDDSRGL